MVNIEVSTTLLIIISAIILLLIIGCIVFIIYKDKKADSKEINDMLNDLVKAKPRNSKKDDNLINAKIEVPIGEKKEPVEVKDEKFDLENMLNKMQESLTSKEEVVENFEQEQEEKSIISYQELLENMNKDTFKKDIEKHEEEQEKTFEEVTKEKVKEFLTKEEKVRKIESPLENKKFKNTDFISPIFGKMDAKIEYPTVKPFEQKEDLIDEIEEFRHARIEEPKFSTIEETIDVKPMRKEINKNDEFLQSLKEFRNNL